MKLYPDQQAVVDAVREQMRQGVRRVMLVAPTGAGKTQMASYMLSGASRKGGRVFFVVHRKELIEQTSEALKQWGCRHGFIAAGMAATDDAVQVCSVDTLRARLDRVEPPTGFIIDEAHRSGAVTYKRLFEAWPDAWVVGLTGTPRRTDGKPLDMYQTMVEGKTARQLMDAGRLASYRLFAPPIDLDMSDVRINRNGEYDRNQLNAKMDGTTIYGNAVQEYLKNGGGEQAAVMCIDIEHAESTADLFRAAGISAACIHGKLPAMVRDSMVEAYRAGHIRVITSVNLILEGFDLASLVVIIWLRPTASLIVWKQGNGRTFRGDKSIILDMVGNVQRHGLPDDDIEWSLEGRKKGKGKAEALPPEITVCPTHYMVATRQKPCELCGWMPPAREREIEEVAGDLVEVDLAAQRRERRQEEAAAQTLGQLIALGKARGYKPGWARHRFKARQGRQQRQRQ